MKRTGCHATKLEEREYSSSDYVHYRKTILEVGNEYGYRITGEYLCEYGSTKEWLCFHSLSGREWFNRSKFPFPNEWSIVNLSLGERYGASVCSGYENRLDSNRSFAVDFFNNGFFHLGTWKPRKTALRDLGSVELNNADVASFPGWVLLEWDKEDLLDCKTNDTDFTFRIENRSELMHLPRLLPIGRMIITLDTPGLLELIRKSTNPGVRLAGVILLSDPEALRSLCDKSDEPAVNAKAAERLALYETLGYFPPDACELSQLSEKDEYGHNSYMYDDDELFTTQSAIHALTHPNSEIHFDWLYKIKDYELAAYISRHDEDEWTRINAAELMEKLHR